MYRLVCRLLPGSETEFNGADDVIVTCGIFDFPALNASVTV